MSQKGTNERNWAVIVGVALSFFIILNVVSYIWFPFLPWTEQRQAGEQIVRQEIDAEKALEDYRWFRTQYREIEAQRNIIQNHYDEEEQFHETYGDDPSQWSRQAETRHNRIHQRITGNQNQLENLVAEYNARSDDATSAVWKCHLPYKVDERFAVTGPPGSGSPETPNDEYVEGADSNRSPPPAEECDALPSRADA